MRLHFLLVEDLAHRALREVGQARMPLRRSMLASVAGQKPRRPQFVGIAMFLRLLARQRYQPCLGLGSDRRLSTRARAIIQRGQRAFGHGALDAALDRLMMQPERSAHRKKRGVFSIGQQYRARSTRLAGSVRDCAIDLNFAVSASPSDNSIARRHAAMILNPFSWGHTRHM